MKFLQYINPSIIVCLLERNGALNCAAIFDVFILYNPTNNAAPIKYLPQKISPTNIPTPKRFPILYIRNLDVARRFC